MQCLRPHFFHYRRIDCLPAQILRNTGWSIGDTHTRHLIEVHLKDVSQHLRSNFIVLPRGNSNYFPRETREKGENLLESNIGNENIRMVKFNSVWLKQTVTKIENIA